MMILAPISEERKVTFAARYVKGEGNSYAAYDVVGVRFIPHISEYKQSQKRDIWYTSSEIREMKQIAFRDIDLRKEEMKYNSVRGKHYQEYTCDIRGLERLVYGDNQDCIQRRFASLRAILQEQHYQRTWMIDFEKPPESDLDEDERIREVCITEGETIKSQIKARQLAKEDEAEVKEYLEEENNVCDNAIQEDIDTKPYQYQQQHFHYQETVLSPMIGRNQQRRQGKKSSSSDDCCWCVEVVDVVGRSLLSHVLLKPFIEMRRPGDVFLEHHS